jgi:hypothetical protein
MRRYWWFAAMCDAGLAHAESIQREPASLLWFSVLDPADRFENPMAWCENMGFVAGGITGGHRLTLRFGGQILGVPLCVEIGDAFVCIL